MKVLSFKKIILIFFVLTAINYVDASAQSKDEIINSSYFVAFGRYANSGELNYWRQQVGNKNIQQMVNNHRDYIRSDKNEREQTIKRSYQDAFGWQPSADEVKYWSGQQKTYAELIANHVNNWLAKYGDKKEQVIRQSYFKVFNRNATTDEVKYWMAQPTCTFVQLVAMHTSWKMKNQSSSKLGGITPNIRNNDVSTAVLSPQAVAGVVAAGGMNVIAPGGANVVAAGGMNVVSAGGAN